MHPIQLAIMYADEIGLDYYPVGKIQGEVLVPDNAIALVGFTELADVLRTARKIAGAICLLKSTHTDFLQVTGDLDNVLTFLSERSANKLDLIYNGTLWIVGVTVSSYIDNNNGSPCLN